MSGAKQPIRNGILETDLNLNGFGFTNGGGSGFQPLSSNLTSWAAITRASGFDAFVATPSVANFKTLLTNEATVVGNLLSLANPSAVSYMRVAADNSVSFITPANLLTDINGQPHSANLDVFAGIVSTEVGRNFIRLTNPASTGYVKAWNDLDKTVTVVTPAALLTDIGAEAALGNPAGNGYVLSSTTLGVRSWVANGSGDALTTNPLSQFAATTSGQLAGVITDETGSGGLVFANMPTLNEPTLIDPTIGVGGGLRFTSSGGGTAIAVVPSIAGTAIITLPSATTTLLGTNAIGSTVQAYDADLTTWAAIARASGFDTFVATPSSANLAALVTGGTGSGALVFATAPTLINPTLGDAFATTLTIGGGGSIVFGLGDSFGYSPGAGPFWLDVTINKSIAFNFQSLTANRIFTWPNASGTVLLNGNIGSTVQAYDADLTTWAGLTPSANAQSLVTAADYAAMRTLLGLVIGTNVQAYDADLTTWAAITPGTGVGTALAINVGTAGSFITNGGALGTPSGGSGANLTSLNASNISSGTLNAARLPDTFMPLSYLDTDPTAAADSDAKVMSQAATRDYVAANAGGSGGVIGTAAFNSSSAISSLVITGIISGVTYDVTGAYLVTFTSAEADAGYIVIANGFDPTMVNAVTADPNQKTINGFTLFSIRAADAAPHDPAFIEFAILRPSQ